MAYFFLDFTGYHVYCFFMLEYDITIPFGVFII